MGWEVILERRTVNRLNEDITKRALKDIVQSVEKNRSLALAGKVGRVEGPEQVLDEHGKEKYLYRAKLRIDDTAGSSPEIAGTKFEMALSTIRRVAWERNWEVISGQENGEQGSGRGPARPPFIVPELTQEVMDTYFAGIYERDSHIRIIHDTMLSFILSNRERRSHTLLYGKPAGAKTTVLLALKAWYEATNSPPERVGVIDATTLTKAGLENWFLNRVMDGTLPEILLLEEIEKNNPNDLLSLLSVMDARGQMQRTNARIGHVKVDARCLVWATCNDLDVLRTFRNGALFSRFQHKLPCVRPSPELMRKILLREVGRMPGGKPEWADAVWEFAYVTMAQVGGEPLADPRTILGLLDGRDRLLDRSYQLDLLKILRAEAEEARKDLRDAEGL